MSTLTKTRVQKEPSRKSAVRVRKASRIVVSGELPPLTKASALYGLDDAIGAVSIGSPSDKISRRKVLRSRIHADNHR